MIQLSPFIPQVGIPTFLILVGLSPPDIHHLTRTVLLFSQSTPHSNPTRTPNDLPRAQPPSRTLVSPVGMQSWAQGRRQAGAYEALGGQGELGG